jgi:PAS domain S-box-containing protein
MMGKTMTSIHQGTADLLRHQSNWMTTLLSTLPALVVILDVKGRIIGFNQACERVSGYAFAEVKNHLIWDLLILPEETAAVQAVFQQLLAQQSPNQHQNHWLTKTGQQRLIAWSNTVLTTADTVQLVVGTGIDITEQQQSALTLQQQIEHEQLLSAIAARIRQSLDLHTILNTTVAEVRQLLQTDRVLIFRLAENWRGMVLVESVNSDQWSSLLGTEIHDPCFPDIFGNPAQPIQTSAIENIYTAPLTPCHRDLLIQFQVQANLVVPILQENRIWGLLIAHHCRGPRQWKPLEVKLLQRLATQLAIAIQQAELYRQLQAELTEREQVEVVLQEAKHHLEQRVAERTTALRISNEKLRTELDTRQQAEAALQHSQARFAGILEIAADAIISVDASQTITLFNQGAEKMFGYTRQEILGQPLDLLLPPAFIATHQQHIQDYAHSNMPAQQMGDERRPILARRRNGTYFNAEASISKLQLGDEQIFTAILRDISERIEAQASLAQLTRQNELILNSMGEGLCGLDLDGHITFINPAAADLLGYAVADLIGQSVELILGSKPQHLDAVPQSPYPFVDSLRSGATHRFISDEFRRQDGSVFPVEYVSTPIREQTRIVGAVITFKDISDRQVVERMKNEFISVVSHELRTPLTSIHGSLRMLTSGLLAAQPEKSQRLLKIAVDSTDRLVRLINDILDVERIESGQVSMSKQPCNIAELMTQATNTMQGLATQMQVTLSVTPLSVFVNVDGDRIVQTLTNLLSNAIKFSPAGGTVWLTAAKVSLTPPSCSIGDALLPADARQPNEIEPTQVCIHVRDQGRGIPPEKMDTIFERFQQADSSDARNHEGTGLGLAICHSIVQQHGGVIWVASQPGQGSTFSFTLPIQGETSVSERSKTNS